MQLVPKKRKNNITSTLLTWYSVHQRILPWRKTHNPYKILVSEIMLQQTQVSRVLIKYREFLIAFPNLQALANASPAEVIRVWKGLGYNRRALFLQKTAQAIRDNHKNVFPKDIKQLCALPGVGDYTARAVLSFAFNQAVPMMDTNHRRFYQRVFFGLEIKKDKELLLLAQEIIPKDDAYDWNQALMDFGSLVCTSQRPTCDICPLKKLCKAYPQILTIDTFQKTKKTTVIPFKQTNRFIRGKIIDTLRKNNSLKITNIVLLFAEFTPERVIKVIDTLQKDNLIIVKNGRILLPI